MPDLSLETALGGIVCGIDEVGRGPLAGPVVAAAVILPAAIPALLTAELDDSKKLKAAKREVLAALVLESSIVGIGLASVAEIDRLNILQATFLAMRRALDGLGRPVEAALVDGNRPPPLPCAVQCVVGGDSRSLSIAAASVVAKVHRDRIMAQLAIEYPDFGWDRNAGYGTRQHMEALARLGPTPHHRTSFAPVAQKALF
ncbi:ribonuclease HII, degrades RNA of DNA-RNA hybrids [Magnetospirillum sp. LM-5]|uniref:ribonuclease HII n=1 Tax=Magnetospirillum sp. LM-5 TaxID=2681466 RepID=UPI00137F3FF8|nr:ribonuclease HII [Magnetospirillum sp. LM-5]CAA7623307.1 ribonuclease HII, degrades RNA of DNA-RNA hybrids [Magnetospirillum sp. LM-5]